MMKNPKGQIVIFPWESICPDNELVKYPDAIEASSQDTS